MSDLGEPKDEDAPNGEKERDAETPRSVVRSPSENETSFSADAPTFGELP